MAVCLPEKIVTQDDAFEEAAFLLNVPKSYIRKASGIATQRRLEKPTRPSEFAARAALKALDNSNINPSDIDIVLYYGVYRDEKEPATAKHVVRHLAGRTALNKSTQALDITNACQGFSNACQVASALIRAGANKHVLVCAGETGSLAGHNATMAIRRAMNGEDPGFGLPSDSNGLLRALMASYTLGDSATAAVITESTDTPFRIERFMCDDDSSVSELCTIDNDKDNGDGAPLVVDPPKLMDIAVPLAINTLNELLVVERSISISDSTLLVHQPSVNTIREYRGRLSAAPSRVLEFVQNTGNLITGSIPMGLQMAQMDSNGEHIFTSSVGSGVSAVSMSINRTKGFIL